jgi:chromosome segregation ATPase
MLQIKSVYSYTNNNSLANDSEEDIKMNILVQKAVANIIKNLQNDLKGLYLPDLNKEKEKIFHLPENTIEIKDIAKSKNIVDVPVDNNETVKIDPITIKIDPVPTKIDPINAKINPITAEIDPISSKMDSIKIEIDPIATGIDPIDKEIEELEAELAIAKLEAKIAKLKREKKASSVTTIINPITVKSDPITAKINPITTKIVEKVEESEVVLDEPVKAKLATTRSAAAIAASLVCIYMYIYI